MSSMTAGSEKTATARADIATTEPANSPRDRPNDDSLDTHAAVKREVSEARVGGGRELVCTRKKATRLHRPKYRTEIKFTDGRVNSAGDASGIADVAAPVLANKSKAPGADAAT